MPAVRPSSLDAHAFASVMPALAHTISFEHGLSTARFTSMASALARVCVGDGGGSIGPFSRWCCSSPISASARSPMTRISAWPGRLLATLLVWAGPAQIILISTLGFRRHRRAIGDRGHRQRDPAVSDGGRGAADDAHAGDQAAASDPGRAFHRGDALGRMLSLPAACAARAADRLRPWARQRAGPDRPGRDRHRL